MSLNMKNANVVRAMKFANEIATTNTKPYFAFIEAAAFAFNDEALKDRNDFRELLTKARADKGEPSMLESKQSEAWSCAQLGEYDCVKPLFANLRKLDKLPGLGGLYDISCAIRGKGQFTDKGRLKADRIKLEKDDDIAPPVAKLQAALAAGNRERNRTKVAGPQTTLAEYLASVIKRLQDARDGKVIKRDDKTGKPLQDSEGKSVKLPAVTGRTIQDALDALQALKAQQDKSRPVLATDSGNRVNGRSKAIAKAAKAKRAA